MNKRYCPLINFHFEWNVKEGFNDLVITDKVKIIPPKEIPDKSILSQFLSPLDYKLYQIHAHNWLVLDGYDDFNYIKEVVNLFQLSLWIIKPTNLLIGFITNFKSDITQHPLEKLSQFRHIPKRISSQYTLDDIEILKSIFPIIIDLYKKNRFKNSIVFNYHGCITNSREVAYIQFSTTFEGLLTHKSELGTKKKLAWACAILTENEVETRQKVFEDFRDIYKIRSEILHGESFKDKFGKGEINLERLANCRDMLRKLWQVILDSEEIIEKLSGNDSVRLDYFKEVANGWMPEEENEKKK